MAKTEITKDQLIQMMMDDWQYSWEQMAARDREAEFELVHWLLKSYNRHHAMRRYYNRTKVWISTN